MLRLVMRADLRPQGARSLLVRAAVHLAIDGRRRSTRELEGYARFRAEAGHETAREAVLIARYDAADVLSAIGMLPRRQRDVLVLRLVHELTVDEVATRLGMTPKTVEGTFPEVCSASEAAAPWSQYEGSATSIEAPGRVAFWWGFATWPPRD